MTDKLSKKSLSWTELGFDYIRTDYRYSAIYENGEWNQGSLTEDDQILIHANVFWKFHKFCDKKKKKHELMNQNKGTLRQQSKCKLKIFFLNYLTFMIKG